MSINSRIKKIRAEFCKGKNIEFAKKLGKKPNETSNWVREGYSIGLNVAGLIANIFNINLSWLLTGEGEMLKSAEPATPSTDNPTIEVPADAWAIIRQQSEQLNEWIEDFNARLDKKDQQIDRLLASLEKKDEHIDRLLAREEKEKAKVQQPSNRAPLTNNPNNK